MSVNNKKVNIVQDIQKNFQPARAVIFYNFQGLENEAVFQLKKELKKAGSY